MDTINKPTLIFDGQCNLCNGIVRFFEGNSRVKLHFLAAESKPAQKILNRFRIREVSPRFVILVEDDTIYIKSAAIIRIGRFLHEPYSLVTLLDLLPQSFCDSIYDIIALNRYAWFGKQDSCAITNSTTESGHKS